MSDTNNIRKDVMHDNLKRAEKDFSLKEKDLREAYALGVIKNKAEFLKILAHQRKETHYRRTGQIFN